MYIKISKWKNNAFSPVVFMIDDIANVVMKKSQSDALRIGEDWGHFGREKNSMWSFLFDNLLSKFPEVKTTFFLVTESRAPMCLHESYTYTEDIEKDNHFKEFLKYLDKNPNIELAYHGTSHGKAAEEYDDFLQEWETFNSLSEATTQINRGKELFKNVLGHYPSGGKYCGYMAGDFGDESIANTHFKWWSYNYDYLKWDKNHENKEYTFDLNTNRGVVNIPTTVDASTLSLKIVKKFFKRKYLKSLYLFLMKRKTIEGHIESLYQNREVISLYEHSSPYRTDKVIQYPNIVSDIDNLNYLFTLLSKKDVWYATCDELANYYLDREKVEIEEDNNNFKLIANRPLLGELTLVFPDNGEELFLCDEEDSIIKKCILKEDEQMVTYQFEINKNYKILGSKR